MTFLPTDLHLRFPYGTFPVDPAFRQQYMQDYSEASSHVLPTHVPLHHPLLRRLEGIYPLENGLPPWWQTCVAQVESAVLKPLLTTVTAHEFRTGCIEASRWKAFRESLTQAERRQWPTSPKIAALVEETCWGASFRNRGSANMPDQLTLILSTQPLDFFYMSNGLEWHSCQHFRHGSANEHLPGNFYDTNVAVAQVLLPQAHVEDKDAVLARTTLRVFSSQQGQTMIALGRTYHNDETLAYLLLTFLAALLDAQRLPWGWIEEVNTLFYCQKGALGTELCQRLDQSLFVESERCWFPQHWCPPYIDGGDAQWQPDREHDIDNHACKQLHANIIRMHPQHIHPQYTSPSLFSPVL